MNSSITGTQGPVQQLMARWKLDDAQKAASAQSATPAHVGAGSTVLLTSSTSSIPLATTGGGNNGNGVSGTGGGSGNGAGSFSNPKWKDPQFYVMAIVALLGSVGLFIYTTHTDPNKVLNSQDIANIRKIAEATGALPQGYVYQGVNQVSTQRTQNFAPQALQEIRPQLFFCRNDEEREAGYALKNITHVQGGSQTLNLTNPGCILTVIHGGIQKLEGKGYRLDVVTDANANPPATKYCGDLAGHSDEECTSFVNVWRGHEMRIVVTVGGGFLKFN